jgi:autotransporter translocation and assembly factor TamB
MVRGGINAVKMLFFLLLLAACSIAAFLSTDFGKAKLVGAILSRVNHQEFHIKIDDIISYFPLDVRFAHIEILDRGVHEIYLRDVRLKLDTFALLQEKRLDGQVDIEECILFDTPPDLTAQRKPIHLPVSLDLDVTCGSSLLEERGVNYFITASIQSGHVHYDAGQDELKYEGKVLFDFSGQPLVVDVAGHGPINDFDMDCKLHGDQFKLQDVRIHHVEGAGHIEHLPWRGDGPINVKFQHEKSAGSLHARLVQDWFLLQLQDVSLMVEGLALKGHATYNTRTIHLQGECEAELDRPQSLTALHGLPLFGHLTLNSKFAVGKGDLDVAMEISGKSLRMNDMSIEALDCVLDLRHALQQPEGSLKVHANNLVGIFGDVRSVKLESAFKNGLGQAALKVDGESSFGNLNLDVNYQKAVKTFKVKALDAMLEGVPVKASNAFEVILKDQSLNISPAELVIMNSPLKLEGSIKDGNLNFKAAGQLDLLTLSRLYLADDDILTGKMMLDMKVSGPWDKPRFEGGAELSGGVYENVIYGTALKDIQLKLNADRGNIRIVSGSAQDAESGTITATGGYHFLDQMLDIHLRGEKVHVLNNDQMKLVVRQADVTLKGPPTEAVIAGLINVDEASYSIAPQVKSERRLLNIKNPVARKKLNISMPKDSSSVSSFNPGLDLVLKFPPVLKIHGRGLSSMWKGKLEIKRTYKNPMLGGYLDVDRGNINFLGQTVDLQKGSIRFDGAANNVPYIDTTGLLEKQDIKVTVGIIGRVDKPTIDLQSQPSMPKDEILSILFFGKDKSKLSPLEGVQLARALAAYKGIGAELDFFSLLTDNLGLDQFTLGSGSAEGTYTVKVSKRLGDKIRVSLNQGTKPEDSKVELEVDVTKNISVKAEHGFAGSADGASVNYNWDY